MEKTREKHKKKDEIIDAATKLFYLNGISGTSFEQIAGECYVTAPLISYHFKTKNNLAKAVMERISVNIKNTISEKIYYNGFPYDLKISTVVEIMGMMKLWTQDQNSRNFYLEFLNCGCEMFFGDNYIDFYKMHDRHYHLTIDRTIDELSLLSTSCIFSAFGLQYAYFTGRLNCSYEQLMEYSISMQFKLMHLPDDEIKRVLIEGKRIFEILDFKVEQFFQIK